MHKISEDGVYQIPLEQHHSDCCDGFSVSSSDIRAAENKTLQHMWLKSAMNPDRVPVEPTAAMVLGAAAHHLLLGEEGFARHYVAIPEELDGHRWSLNRKTHRAWYDARIEEGRRPLTPKQVCQIRGMAQSLTHHPWVQRGVLNGQIERTIAWRDETGIWCKSRPDVIPESESLVIDLKCMSSADYRFVANQISNSGYHIQMALAGIGMERVCDIRPQHDDYALLIVEQEPPHTVALRFLGKDAISWGRAQIRRTLDRIKVCLQSNCHTGEHPWPGYGDDGEYVGLSTYRTMELENDQELRK